jgi:hypothetical protein
VHTRTSEAELLRIRAVLIHSAQLLSIESIALAIFTPLTVAALMTKVGPILLRLQRLILGFDQAIFGYASAEGKLVTEFSDFRISPSELAAGSIVATGILANPSVWVRAKGSSQMVIAPDSLVQLTSRMRLLSEANQPVVRIEKYADGSTSRFVVYVPGTQAITAGTANPLDMRSNLQLLAGQQSASSRAVDMAIRKAGAKAGDRVMLVGHSQGGLIAVDLAKRSKAGLLDYRVDNVVTFGSPVGSNSADALPEVLSVENKVDFVPQFDLIGNPKGENWLTLERNVFGDPISAHQMEAYGSIVSDIERSGEFANNSVWQGVEKFATTKGEVSFFELGQRRS